MQHKNVTRGRLVALTLTLAFALACDAPEDGEAFDTTSESSSEGSSEDSGSDGEPSDFDAPASLTPAEIPPSSAAICVWSWPGGGATEPCPSTCYRTAIDHMVCGLRECTLIPGSGNMWSCQ